MSPEFLDIAAVFVAPVADGADAAGALLVRWQAEADAGRLFQVYVNGELAGVTGDPADREMLVPGDGSELAAVAVAAVALADADADFAHLLGPQSAGRRALLRWARTNAAEIGATMNLYGDGGTGTLDMDSPLNDEPIAWFADGGKWGFGLGGFGESDFAYDGGGAIGFGLGGQGIGEFGFDAPWSRWLSEPLAGGEHRFAAVGFDRLGNAAAGSPPQTCVRIADPPPRIVNLAVSGNADAIELNWELA